MANGAKRERAFEELFKKNYSRLFYCALDWVEDDEAAKDIVSDLFSKVWTQYDRLQGSPLEGYLYRAVKNRCANYLRNKMVENRHQEMYHSIKEEIMEEDEEVHEEQLKRIDEVMESFTPQTRFIFEQCYFEGKSYQEMASLMDLSISTIHKHISKAFASFRKAFDVKKRKPNGSRLRS